MSSIVDTAEHLFRCGLQQAQFAAVLLSERGEVLEVNTGFENLTGYSADEILNENLLGLRSAQHSEDFYAGVWSRLQFGDPWDGFIWFLTKHQENVRALVSVTPVRTESDRVSGYLAVAQATDNDPALQLQALQSQKMEAIGQLAAGIAHEMNTPTQYVGDNIHFLREAICGFINVVELTKQFLAHDDSTICRSEFKESFSALAERVDLEFLLHESGGAVTRALEGNNRVAEVVRAMKEFAYPSSLERSPIDINHTIETTVAVARNEWKYAADVRLHLDESLPTYIGLQGPIQQAMLNLLVNAAHAIQHKRGNTLSAKGTIDITTFVAQGEIVIEFRDSGCGIPADIRTRIFEPFFTTKEIGKGTGQGLAIVYSSIVDQHDGKVELDSKVNVGTCFRVRLPIDEN